MKSPYRNQDSKSLFRFVFFRPFEIYIDPNMTDVTNFCLPGLLPLLKHSVSYLSEVTFINYDLKCLLSFH